MQRKKKNKKEIVLNDFVALDFETANFEKTSVCSVGIVIVRNRCIQEKYYHMIRPAPNRYEYWCTRVHGLTDKDTRRAQTFPEVWQEILPMIEGLPIIAHNSAFDEGCLKAVHQYYGMPYPNYVFHCTYQTSRRKLPQLEKHNLQMVATALGFPLAHHHHALADAEACAHIGLYVFAPSPEEVVATNASAC